MEFYTESFLAAVSVQIMIYVSNYVCSAYIPIFEQLFSHHFLLTYNILADIAIFIEEKSNEENKFLKFDKAVPIIPKVKAKYGNALHLRGVI